ncbi:MAG TPA: Fur-regulated basic protein FbpA [Bacillales bacterium]|nr:Fur-regulated basic protein FbpA [Bacillales bacterium]
MSQQLRKAVERKKQTYIQRLLDAGIYKSGNCQLYELTLSELEKEYAVLQTESNPS